MNLQGANAIVRHLWRRPPWLSGSEQMDLEYDGVLLDEASDGYAIRLVYCSDPNAGRDATWLHAREMVDGRDVHCAAKTGQNGKLIELFAAALDRCIRSVERILFHRRPPGWRWHRHYRGKR